MPYSEKSEIDEGAWNDMSILPWSKELSFLGIAPGQFRFRMIDRMWLSRCGPRFVFDIRYSIFNLLSCICFSPLTLRPLLFMLFIATARLALAIRLKQPNFPWTALVRDGSLSRTEKHDGSMFQTQTTGRSSPPRSITTDRMNIGFGPSVSLWWIYMHAPFPYQKIFFVNSKTKYNQLQDARDKKIHFMLVFNLRWESILMACFFLLFPTFSRISSPEVLFFSKYKSNRDSAIGSRFFSFNSISNVKGVCRFETQLFPIVSRHGVDVSFFP